MADEEKMHRNMCMEFKWTRVRWGYVGLVESDQ